MAASKSPAAQCLPPYHRDAAARTTGRTVSGNANNDTVTFAAFSAETDGAYSSIDVTVAPGGGVPYHFHTRIREIFTAGPLGCGIELDGETQTLEPGQSATVEVGHAHRFFNHCGGDVDGGTAISLHCRAEAVDGGGTEGLEKSLYLIYGLARDGLVGADGTPSSMLHLAVIAGLGDTNLPGWGFWLATPLLRALQWYARFCGEEDRLVRRYWYGEAV